MNQTFFDYAMNLINNMSDDDMSESLVGSGLEFETAERDPIYVTFSQNTARAVEFRKMILGICRETLQDTDWAFFASHGIFGTTAITRVAIVVWDSSHAVLLKLAAGDILVDVTSTQPDLKRK